MTLICGIDEAGRGPVIGPMVISGVLITDSQEELLKKIGVKDSKLLTPQKREELFKKIKTIVKKYKIIIIEPQEIDDALESEDMNLNLLEAKKTSEIIDFLKPDVVYVDCPSNNISQYITYIKNNCKHKTTQIIAEHKADLNYVVVSAASILSKVTRDEVIKKIKQKVKQDIGSGYPSDPITKIFLEKNYKKYPEIFRKTWYSYKNILDKESQKNLFEY